MASSPARVAKYQASLQNPNLGASGRAKLQYLLDLELAKDLSGPARTDAVLAARARSRATVASGSGIVPVSGGLSTLRADLSGAMTPNALALLAGGAVALGLGAAGTVVAVRHHRKAKRKASGKGQRGGNRQRSGAARIRRAGPRLTHNRKGGAVKDRYRGSKVYRTKRGQPYIILGSGPMKGRARFIRA